MSAFGRCDPLMNDAYGREAAQIVYGCGLSDGDVKKSCTKDCPSIELNFPKRYVFSKFL
jgi:hypothetical protein